MLADPVVNHVLVDPVVNRVLADPVVNHVVAKAADLVANHVLMMKNKNKNKNDQVDWVLD